MNDDPIQTIISDERQRFLLDLEFVQSLANPQYLNFLAQRNYLKNPAFVNYLKYLLYFKREEYIKHIRYPQALNFLDLLQREEFRQELANSSYCRYIEDQQLLAWQRLQRRKINLLTNPPGLTTSSTGAAATTAANSVNNANTPSNESDAMNLSNNNGALSSSTNNGQIR